MEFPSLNPWTLSDVARDRPCPRITGAGKLFLPDGAEHGPRGAQPLSHPLRALRVTEGAIPADTHGALRSLAGLPCVDSDRIAVMGFSCGAMVPVFAACRQMARLFAPDRPRFTRWSLKRYAFMVEPDNRARDQRRRLSMRGPASRTAMLIGNTDPRGYHMLRDERVMAHSDDTLLEFLSASIGRRTSGIADGGMAERRGIVQAEAQTG